MDWDGLLTFGEKQAIVGVLYRGLKRLEGHPCRPDKYKIIEWYTANEQIVEDNRKLNKASARVTYLLYKKDGVKACVLKGQGNALRYPDPLMRTSGDIDLWTSLTTDELLRYIMKVSPESGIEYHHIDFPVFNDAVTEIHIMPSFMGNLFYERRLIRSRPTSSARSLACLRERGKSACRPTASTASSNSPTSCIISSSRGWGYARSSITITFFAVAFPRRNVLPTSVC